MDVSIKCPRCNNIFQPYSDFVEEVVKPDITIDRTTHELDSWASIANQINSGYGYRVISVGDKISFLLKDGKTVSVVAVSANPYWDNSMAFCFENCISEHNMNNDWTNVGGWHKSEMRKYYNDEIIPLLPDELVRVIKERTIIQIKDGKRFESRDKIWALSRTEVFGETAEYKNIDFGDVHFEFFCDEKSRVKMLNGSTASWWERSPYYSGSSNFCGVYNIGSAYYYLARFSGGVAPAFII